MPLLSVSVLLMLARLLPSAKKPPRVGPPMGQSGDLITAPVDQSAASYDEWNQNLSHFHELHQRLDRNLYELPELQWASTAFVETQVMIHDKFLFDRDTGEWTVDRFLSDLRQRYGGVEIVLLWHSYPNIGIDDRCARCAR